MFLFFNKTGTSCLSTFFILACPVGAVIMEQPPEILSGAEDCPCWQWWSLDIQSDGYLWKITLEVVGKKIGVGRVSGEEGGKMYWRFILVAESQKFEPETCWLFVMGSAPC